MFSFFRVLGWNLREKRGLRAVFEGWATAIESYFLDFFKEKVVVRGLALGPTHYYICGFRR